MDWATLFKDNSQSIFTLVGVFLGSAITFLISYLNNRFEAKERDKDRDEKRKEAKMQAREKWIERDILVIMDSLEKKIELLSKHRNIEYQLQTIIKAKEGGLITEQEYNTEAKLLYANFSTRYVENNLSSDIISRLVYSFDDAEIISAYRGFVDVMGKYMNVLSDFIDNSSENESADNFDIDDISWIIVTRQAGKFQQVLRDKLISIRDT